jgi:hypothetical protein
MQPAVAIRYSGTEHRSGDPKAAAVCLECAVNFVMEGLSSSCLSDPGYYQTSGT